MDEHEHSLCKHIIHFSVIFDWSEWNNFTSIYHFYTYVTHIANIDFLIGHKLVYWKFIRYTLKLLLSSIPMYVSSAYKTVF